MARHCTICDDPRRGEIDAALVGNAGYRAIAKRFGLSESAAYRHKNGHIPLELQKANDAMEIASADSLLEQVRSLQERALHILAEAEEAGDLRVALQAVREARGNLELLAKLMGEINEGVAINLGSDWSSLRTTILEALEPFPEARAHLAAVLEESN